MTRICWTLVVASAWIAASSEANDGTPAAIASSTTTLDRSPTAVLEEPLPEVSVAPAASGSHSAKAAGSAMRPTAAQGVVPLVAPHAQKEELPGPQQVPDSIPAGRIQSGSPSLRATPVRFPTHPEFARSFNPAPGNYEAVILHPYSCQPVRVCFTLPAACLKKTRVERGELEFDYGDVEVELRFRRDGRVRVEYRD